MLWISLRILDKISFNMDINMIQHGHMHQRRRSLPTSSWRQHSSQHHKIVLHLVYLGVLSQSEGFGRHGAGEGRWGREWCSFGHGTWFLNGLSLSMSLCHMVRRKSCKVLKVWPKTRLYCKICKMHCTLKSVCTGAKVMEDPRRVPWHRAVGLLDKEGPGGDFEGLWRSLRPHLSISRWVRPNVGWFMSIYVDYMSLDSVLNFQLLS